MLGQQNGENSIKEAMIEYSYKDIDATIAYSKNLKKEKLE